LQASLSNTWSQNLAPEASSEARAPEAASSSLRPSDDGLAHAAVDAFVLDDLQVTARARFFDAEKHGAPFETPRNPTRASSSSVKTHQAWHHKLPKRQIRFKHINDLRLKTPFYCSSRAKGPRRSRRSWVQ
jgi:hypothetical protein